MIKSNISLNDIDARLKEVIKSHENSTLADKYVLNFGGFYNNYEYYIDSHIESETDYIIDTFISENKLASAQADLYDDIRDTLSDNSNCNYPLIYDDIGEIYVEHFNDTINDNLHYYDYDKCNISFIGVNSPTYYNYSTDTFIVDIDHDDLLALLSSIDTDDLLIYVKSVMGDYNSDNRYFYPNDNDDTFTIQFILDFLSSNNDIKEQFSYLLCDDISEITNKHINWSIVDTIIDARLNDYLLMNKELS